MKAAIDFVFYHDGITPTEYLAGADVPEDVQVPAEWLADDSAPAPKEKKGK